ncbi:hypothetical protein HanIR_Chr01g0045941 [Helianthus annuus]|nr:hypothetical protein HanIR_Chr01g0045941 [Helianthus annuus]
MLFLRINVYYVLALVSLFDSLCVILDIFLYVLILVLSFHYLSTILDMLSYVFTLVCVSPSTYTSLMHFTRFFFLKLENTHIIRTRRAYQNRRETHNLVNDSHPT